MAETIAIQYVNIPFPDDSRYRRTCIATDIAVYDAFFMYFSDYRTRIPHTYVYMYVPGDRNLRVGRLRARTD